MRPFTLHQTLHGYKDGHRALASSITLDAQDAKTLLVLSDVSGPGSRLETSGYLTGYPLPNAGLYALARTWSAPEMPRPGCVWTHTLLVDFADLATVIDTVQFLRCFRRPEGDNYSAYNQALLFDESPQREPVSEKVESIYKALVFGLYQFPSHSIVSFSGKSESSEEAVLAVWGQQWPRLRRSFRFCTLALSDRSTKEATFDLQLLPPEMPSVISRFPNAIEAKTPDPEPDWLHVAVTEISMTGDFGLRQFLFQAGSDLQEGRAAFANLCRIFCLLAGADVSKTGLETAIELIPESSTPLGARALTRIMARKLFDEGSQLSKRVLSFLVDRLEFLDIESGDDRAAVFGLDLLKSQPMLFKRMAGTGDLGRVVASAAFNKATTQEIIAAVEMTPTILSIAISVRPMLLNETEIWRKVDKKDIAILDCLDRLKNKEPALRAAIIAERHDLFDALLEQSSRDSLFSAIYDARESLGLISSALKKWIIDVGTPEVVAEFLSSKTEINGQFLIVLSQVYEPDEIPDKFNSDPWLSAMMSGHGELSSEDEINLYKYLLARALGIASKNSGELALYSFEVTDQAAAHGQLTYSSWNQLERYLPRPAFWQDWDKCFRIRKGVAEKCIEDNWSAEVFLGLTSDDEVFENLVWFVERRYRGREYLKIVKNFLKNKKGEAIKKRYAIIKKILRKY